MSLELVAQCISSTQCNQSIHVLIWKLIKYKQIRDQDYSRVTKKQNQDNIAYLHLHSVTATIELLPRFLQFQTCQNVRSSAHLLPTNKSKFYSLVVQIDKIMGRHEK